MRRSTAHFIAGLSVLLLASSLGLPTASAQRRRRATPRIAVVVDGPGDGYRLAIQALAAEVTPLLAGTYPDFVFPAAPTHEGDFTDERANALVAEVLADREIDLVVALGLSVGQAVARVEALSKPVILPFASPPLQGLPRDEDGASGRSNLFYITGLFDLPRDLRNFHDVIRRDRVAIIVDPRLLAALPNASALVQRAVGDTMHVTLVPAGMSAAETLAALPADAEAVYLGPMPRLPATEIPALIAGVNDRDLPSYASQGRSFVELGAYTTLVPDDELQQRLRRTALVIEDALRGADLSQMSTAFERRTALLINMRTARQIQVWPRFELMTEAELLHADDVSHGRPISFRDAIREGLSRNLDLAAREQDRVIAEAQYDDAMGNLVPTLNLNAQAAWVDPDGTSPLGRSEREISYGIEGQQVLYSPRATSGLRAADARRSATNQDVDSVVLDTVRDVALAYLDVLRARTAAEVNRENLGRVRRNLALAEVRVDVGAASPSEVHRWEIEIASSRANVVQASATRNQAEIALNRLLNRPQEQTLQLAEPTDPETGIVLDPEITAYVDDPASFDVFRDFMVQEALENSPELRRLGFATETQRQVLVGQRQQLFVPDLLLTGGINHTVGRWGNGSEDIAPTPGLPIAARDNFSWQVAVVLQFNIFSLSRYAQIDQTEAQVRQLSLQGQSVALQVEQRTRSALHAAGASSTTVRLRQDAARAAQANLDLVVDAYRQGGVSIITLVDAQNQLLQAELGAANAVYDFLRDFIEVERAAGRYSFLADAEDNRAFVQRLARFSVEQRQTGTER